MSKCQINITFDRSDRVYYGGESVTGKVRLIVDQQTKSNGVKLTHHWKTHGRGNADIGPPEEIQLIEPRVLEAGEQFEFPFAVTSATHPVTYHGHLVHIDHYVRVEVDVPWARNPFAEEEYELRPGLRPELFTGERGKVVSLNPRAPVKNVGPIGKTVLWIILGIILIAVAMTAFFLLPIILVVAAFVWVKKKALKSRLGDVEVSVPIIVVGPTEDWTIGIRFTPRKSFVVTGIDAELIAEESAVSGSGTNKTTHRHKVFSEKHLLLKGGLLEPDQLIDPKVTISFPATNAYSFDFTDNALKWTVNFRIDIPGFPDWTHTEPLQVVPLEFLNNQIGIASATAEVRPTDRPLAISQGDDAAIPAVGMQNSPLISTAADLPPELPVRTNAPKSEELSSPETIEEVVSLFESAGRNSAQRNLILEAVAGEIYEVSVLIDRISTSFGADFAPEFLGGKTVIGQIIGTQRSIEIIAPDSMNDELESFRRSDTWQGRINITAWDSLYNRLRGTVVD